MKKKTSKIYWLERLSVYKARCVAWPQFSQKNEKNYLLYGETLNVFTCIATSCKYCHTSIANFQGYISAQGCQKVCNSGGVGARSNEVGTIWLPGWYRVNWSAKNGEVGGGGMCNPPAPGGLWSCCMVAMSYLDTRAGWVRWAEKS